MDSLLCDFCGSSIENFDGSAFSDGSGFSNFPYDTRIACIRDECCGNIKFEEGEA